MKMNRLVGAALAAVMALSLAACGSSGGKDASGAASEAAGSSAAEGSAEAGAASEAAKTGSIAKEDIKVGYILVGDENEGYSAAHIDGAKAMAKTLGLSEDQIIYKYNVPEDETAYDAAVDLADQGCNIVFATSFGFEPYVIEAAKEYPDVQFCHATGYQAASSGLSNMHNYFTSIYEARYVSGVVGGMKLKQMISDGKLTADQAKVGYVGAYPYAEVISGYTAFFLGVRSVVPEATMEVKYTNSWGSFDLEKEAADALISDGCVLIGQHADTTGAPTAAEAAGVPCVGYNISMIATAPDEALTSATNDWSVYPTMAVEAVMNGTKIPVDWCKGLADGAVGITELNDKAVALGTAEIVQEVEDKIKSGKLHVFDTSTFTVDGKTLDTYKKEGSDNEYISDGYFHESEFASSPAFDILIDGITTIES